MFTAHPSDFYFIALCIEGFFYGLYSGILAIYFQYQASNKETNKTKNVIFYCICILYVLSMALFVSNIIIIMIQLSSGHMGFIQTTLFACCDLIAQFILIYRCWIVWGRNTHIVIIPSMLTFTFLATWLASSVSEYILSCRTVYCRWELPVTLTSLALSLTVNALVTGLIVFRIFKVFREVKAISDDRILGAAGGSKLRGIMFILIESGMALFLIQSARLVVTIRPRNHAFIEALAVIGGIQEMLNGITPTIILMRTSMGLSFNDETSIEEVAVGSLRFASNHLDSVSETGSIGIVVQDNRNDDDIGIEQSNEIELVER